MGLSASQARLLSLTARQSNLEYEGQQINQQRTTLSNASSNYYNSLLEMKVPVPPSTNDYTKIVYTFNIGGNPATVKEALPKSDELGNSKYYVSYTTTLSTIGVAENESYKTGASGNSIKAYVDEVGTKDESGYYNPSELKYNENKSYYLAAMNATKNQDEVDKLRSDRTAVYVATEKFSGAENEYPTEFIVGPDGYVISYAAYQSIVAAANPKYYKETENEDGETIPLTAEQIEANNKLETEKNQAEENLKKCKFFREYDENNSDDTTATKYALSYAQLANENSFNAHKKTDRIFEIEEFIEANPRKVDGKEVEPQTGVFFYKSSSGNFTVVESQYRDAFLSAGLNADDYYQYPVTSGDNTTYRFVKREDVEGNLNSQTRSISTSAVTTIQITKENTISEATLEFDNQGRISTLTDEEGHTYTMTATTEKDDAAYQDAYNQYEYDQYIYDQRQSEINANIKILQAQDKSLELRLSNLDTQHSAIQTELEAVKKVMSKNIDNSFKTFNA